jgi:molybdate transport system ATP-binding protein
VTLEVDIGCRLGGLALDAEFTTEGGVTALFGRSGAGKTSIVNAIAGLLRPARGRIAVDGALLFDRARGVDLPRHRRRVGYVFQDARLFPHLTVRHNLLYGRWFTARAQRRGGFEEVVELLGVGPLLARRPGTLSGGERQRVAIGRALLASPRLLLMDEPLASLDQERKDEILPYLDRLRSESRVPIVYVSHALDEVTRLADAMVVVSDGRVAAAGPVAEIMSRLDLGPLTGRAEAGSVLTATVAGQHEAYQLTELSVLGQPLLVPRVDTAAGTAVRLRVRARDVAVATRVPDELSIRNHLFGRVAAVRPEPGAFAELAIDLGGPLLRARVTRHAVDELGLAPGKPVVALIKAVAVERRLLGPSDGGPSRAPPAPIP